MRRARFLRRSERAYNLPRRLGRIRCGAAGIFGRPNALATDGDIRGRRDAQGTALQRAKLGAAEESHEKGSAFQVA